MKIINWKILSILLIALNYNVLSAKQSITEEQAKDVVNNFIKNLKEQNIDELNLLLDENYTHIHGTGLVENKETFINALKNKTRTYEVADVSELKITNLGNASYALAKLNIKVITPKGTLEATNLFTIIMHTNKHNDKKNKDKKDKGKAYKITISQFQATKIG